MTREKKYDSKRFLKSGFYIDEMRSEWSITPGQPASSDLFVKHTRRNSSGVFSYEEGDLGKETMKTTNLLSRRILMTASVWISLSSSQLGFSGVSCSTGRELEMRERVFVRSTTCVHAHDDRDLKKDWSCSTLLGCWLVGWLIFQDGSSSIVASYYSSMWCGKISRRRLSEKQSWHFSWQARKKWRFEKNR